MKGVKLIFEYDLGEFGEEDEEYEISIDPKDWYEYFHQMDVCDFINEAKIKEVVIYEKNNN